MMLTAALQMSLTFFIAATGNSEEQTLFLERGCQGIVPCNPNASSEYTFDDLEGVYWYFGQYDRDHFIFSHFQGNLYEGEDIPKGMYNISNDFSLIIQNVTDSDEGTYYYKVEPLVHATIYTGSAEVAVKVTTKQPFPVVPGCDPRPSVLADSCIVHDPYDIQTVSLTCELNHAKPPVDLQWFRVFDDGHTEHIEATLTTKLLVHKPGLFFIDNTYTSLSSFHLLPTSDNITRYRCEAYGVALGDTNGSHVSVTVSKDAFPSHADWKAFLDRGGRGIVPYSPDAAWAHQRGDLQGVYWYFRQRDREHVIFSYFQGATVPLDGIPEGMYNVTSNFSLIIQNVTDSHEGTYYYVVESKVGQIDKGSVEVVVKGTTSEPVCSSPAENTDITMIVLVVIFAFLSLFFGASLLILLIRHCRLKMVGGNIATNGMEMIHITSDESSPMLHGTKGARSAPYPPWESLASRLGYKSEDIAYFKSIHPGQPEEQIWLMLIDWRGKGSSPVANTTNLCHALAAFGGKDLAFELQRLNDRDLQKISRDLDDKWEDLALKLGMNNGELLKLKKRKAKLQKKAYDVLDTWRKRQSTKEDGPKVLYTALDKVGKEDLANKLRKENKSFLGRMRRLYKVACMLTPEHDREVFMSEEFQLPPRLVIECHGDLESLRNDLKDVSERLEVNKLTIWCRSLEDLEFLREFIQSNKIIDAPVQLELAIILSTQWKEQLQCLRETFKPEMKFYPLYLALYGHAGDDCHDMKSVGNCLCHISNIFPKRFGTSLLDMIRSPEDVKSLVNAVRGCKLRLFGCPGTDLNGHVGLLAPLNTAYLEELWLSDCNLKDDDVSDLKDILLEGRKLQWLNIGTNKFSVDGISNITGHLTRERFPNLYRLDVEYKGPDVAQVSEVVVRNLPHLKETDTGIFQLLK